jgi:serine/threonine protein kinase
VIGKNLAHYRIPKSLGKGGMGEVYLAEDTKLNRRVALKLLPPEVAGDPERRRRFEREAQAVAALNHPNIVTIHSVEEVDGIHFLTMERLEGETLDAVSASHERGITHRDLKPDNIIVTDDGRREVLDFGLAKLREEVRDA